MIISYKGKTPKTANDCFVAENAALAGDIVVDSESSIWFSVSIRAEHGPVRIGKVVNIQDNSVIHTDTGQCVIKDNVSVGHSAVIHGATIGENTLVGMGAILLNGSKIGKNCIIGAGALVTQGTEFPDESLILGAPATLKRKLKPEEIVKNTENAKRYSQFRKEYLEAMNKSV
ncbi:MAG: gamma carbonic anhydrase family protein [Nitrososphaerota archaeon]|nr:gamma carbonic anhydrase family protein [Nitrososphaerota archaeon]MDG6922198.1 gamma carbonic anhydrase family protein [Nitrososphaerota archaeon]